MHRVNTISASHASSPRRSLGWTRSWEETQLKYLIPTAQRDIPYHMASCSAFNAEEEEEQEGIGRHLEWWRLSWSPALSGVAEHLPAQGWNPCFALLVCALLLYLLNYLYFNSCIFSFLLFPIQLRQSEPAVVWC